MLWIIIYVKYLQTCCATIYTKSYVRISYNKIVSGQMHVVQLNSVSNIIYTHRLCCILHDQENESLIACYFKICTTEERIAIKCTKRLIRTKL